jgi:hypothetical protein
LKNCSCRLSVVISPGVTPGKCSWKNSTILPEDFNDLKMLSEAKRLQVNVPSYNIVNEIAF